MDHNTVILVFINPELRSLKILLFSQNVLVELPASVVVSHETS